MHQRVTSRSAAVVYLHCRLGYTSGIFMEVLDEAQAVPLLAKFKHTQIEKPVKAKMDYKAYYERLYK